MYNYDIETYNNSVDVFTAGAVWTLVAFIIAVIGGIVVYFVFFKPDKEMPNKFLTWVKDFCNFKTMLVEDILKVLYCMLAIFITLLSLSMIVTNIIACILLLLIGNLILRVVFELCLINIMIWKNTNDINKKIKSAK